MTLKFWKWIITIKPKVLAEKINDYQIHYIKSELERTGVKAHQITSQYRVKSIGELNFEQWREIHRRFSITPDKPTKANHDEKISLLANELIKTIQTSGRSIWHPEISEGFGHVDLYVQNFGTDGEILLAKNICNGWEVAIKPTFTKED